MVKTKVGWRSTNWLAAMVVFALIGTLATPASAELLLNGGFEDGDTGPINGAGVPTNWFAWGPESGWHHDDAGKVIDTKAVKFWWDDIGMWQDFAVTAGDEYLFSVEALNHTDDTLTGWNGLLIAEFYDSGSGDKLLDVVVDKYFSASDPVNEWVNVSGTVQAPVGADLGRMILKIGDWTEGVGGSLNLDNASVTLVPEPAALVGMLAVALLALRRR